jgi:hypothetical protein
MKENQMFAERGAQTEDETRAAIRVIPGLLRIWGFDGEEDEQDPSEDEQEDEQEDEDGDESEDDGDSDDEEAKGKKKKKTPSLEDQLDEERRLRAKAERALKRQEKAKDEAEADKDITKDRDKYKAKVEARDKFLTESLLQIEVQKQKKYDFVDVEDVVAALQRDEDVHIDLDADTPSVEGLDMALKRLAKKKPHWLKKDKDDEEESGPPSGARSKGGKSEDQDSEDRRIGEKFKIPGYGTHVQRVM